MQEQVDSFRRDLVKVLRDATDLHPNVTSKMTFDHSMFCTSAKDLLAHLGVLIDERGRPHFEDVQL